MTLTAEQILNASDCPMERVHVPEWNGDVLVRSMTCAQLDEWIRAQDGKSTADADVKASFLVATICDDNGAPLFTLDQVGALNEKNGSVLTRLYLKARKLNPISDDDIEDEVGK